MYGAGLRGGPAELLSGWTRRSARIGGTGGVSAVRQRREQERTPEASAGVVRAFDTAVAKEGAK